MSWSSARALARVAWRDVGRHRWRSILVALLVLLPVAGMVAGIAIYRTTTPTPEAEDLATFGRADLLAFNTTRAELEAHLPTGTTLEPTLYTDGRIVLPGARPGVSIRALDLDGLAAGILAIRAGSAPAGAGQVAISEATAELAGVRIGGRIEVADVGTREVVGIVENPRFLGDRFVLFDPSGFQGGEDSMTWLIALPEGVDPEAIVEANTDPETGEQNILIQSRQSGGIVRMGEDSGSASILILGTLALVEAALIASAAFAVSIRRRQRELGLLAATGATPRALAGTVFAEAAIIGIAACAGGVVVGVAGALALTPWLDELTQHRNPALVVDASGLAGPVVIGFLAALLAAVIPARTVARVPVLLALSGRRPPQAPARRTLRLGLAAVAAAAAMTLFGATMHDAGSGTVSLVLLVGGAVLSTLGFGACGPWLLERLEGIAARLPLPGRIAFRDTARGRSRSSPIVTAVLASFAAAIAIGAFQASRDYENLAGWVPSLYPDQLSVDGPGADAAGEVLRAEDGVIEGALIPYLVADDDPNVMVQYELPDAHDHDGKLINTLDQCGNCTSGAFSALQVYRPALVTPEVLALAGVDDSAIEADLAAGRAVVLSYRAGSATTLEIKVWADIDSAEPTQRLTLPVRLIQVPVPGGRLPDLFLPEATIAELGLAEPGEGSPYETAPFVVRYDHNVTETELSHAQEVASRFPDTTAIIDTPPVRPGEGFRILIIALVLLFALSVTGVAIALGEAESRPEQRSLLAIGADPRLRRQIAAARAGVLALLAGLLAVPAGLLPIWGIFLSRGSPLAVPAIEIVGAVVALPVLAIVSSFLLSRPIPDWNAFRNVRPGE